MRYNTVIYISTNGGAVYREMFLDEHDFKNKTWTTVCKWLRPDSDMVINGYGSRIIVRDRALNHVVTLDITGGDDLTEVWGRICDAWDLIARVCKR